MSVQVTKLPNEPIIILTYEGLLDVETVKSAFQQSVELMQNIDGPVYRISDVRAGDADERGFAELFKLIGQLRNGVAGSSADPRIHGVFVGGNQLARLYADFMRQNQFGSRLIPFYQTVDEALEYIHFEINKAKS